MMADMIPMNAQYDENNRVLYDFKMQSGDHGCTSVNRASKKPNRVCALSDLNCKYWFFVLINVISILDIFLLWQVCGHFDHN